MQFILLVSSPFFLLGCVLGMVEETQVNQTWPLSLGGSLCYREDKTHRQLLMNIRQSAGSIRTGGLKCPRESKKVLQLNSRAACASLTSAWGLRTADCCQLAKNARCCLPIRTFSKGSGQRAALAVLIKP